MKLATTTGDFSAYTHDQNEALRYIREAGFHFADYNFGSDFADRSGVFGTDWQEHIAQVKRTADELGVTLIQSHSPMGKPIVKDANYNDFVWATQRCIESCGMLGIPTVVVHSGYDFGLSREETFERNREFYNLLTPVAEKWNVNVLVENFNRMCVDNLYWIDNAFDLREQIDVINHPLVHACWDAGHGNMQDTPQDESLRALSSHVLALHVQDNRGDTDSHLVPFCGSLNVDSLMHGLKEIGYTGYFTFEACSMLYPRGMARREWAKDTRLYAAPLSLRIAEEKLLYEIGRTILTAYDCFEE